MKKINAILGLGMSLALAGAMFAAQTTPAPAAKTASAATKSTAKKHSGKHKKSTGSAVKAAAPTK